MAAYYYMTTVIPTQPEVLKALKNSSISHRAKMNTALGLFNLVFESPGNNYGNFLNPAILAHILEKKEFTVPRHFNKTKNGVLC